MESNVSRLNLLFVDSQKIIFRRLMRILGDCSIAEEITQEAYIRTRKSLEMTGVQNIEALLWTTARNLAFDHLRREKVRSRSLPDDGDDKVLEAIADDRTSVEENLIHKDQIRIVLAALEKLPTRAKECWTLSRVDGKSYPDIAVQLGVSPNTVFNDIKMVLGVLYDLRKKLEA